MRPVAIERLLRPRRRLRLADQDPLPGAALSGLDPHLLNALWYGGVL